MTVMKTVFFKILPVLLVIALDQITKEAVMGRIETGHITVTPFFNLVLVWNPGISFGMLTDGIVTGPLPLILFSIAMLLFFAVWLWRTDHKWLGLAIGAVIGGALGNVIDRVRFGAVIDFLDFHAFGWHYPAFNVADSAIVLGIAFVVLDGLFCEPKRKGASKP